MGVYEVRVTVTYETTITMSGYDYDRTYDKVESMIENGEIELDLEKDLLDYEIDEDFKDWTEETWGCDMYHQLKAEGVL